MSETEAAALSVEMFAAMNALTCAEARLQHTASETATVPIHQIVSILLYASRVAYAACEAALTRVEPMYETDTRMHETEEHIGCKTEVAFARERANTVASALEFASTQYAAWVSSSFSLLLLLANLCSNEAMHAAIDGHDMGAVALCVVLLPEAAILAPRGLFLYTLCAYKPNIQILRMLLSSPALVAHITDRTPVDWGENTVLMVASKAGCTDAICALLAFPAIIESANAVNNNGDTALIFASSCSCTATEALLALPHVAESADVCNNDGTTALMVAAMNGYADIVRALLACPAVTASAGSVDGGGNTALMLASHGVDDDEAILVLLACPSVVESAAAADQVGNTALMIAAQYTPSAIVITSLLSCTKIAASANAVNKQGYTALALAARCGDATAITALLACPQVWASADTTNRHGSTALMLASRYGHGNAIQALLTCPQVRATVNDVNDNGQTALMIASLYKHSEAVDALLKCPGT
jgi:ankyrin repeat protein